MNLLDFKSLDSFVSVFNFFFANETTFHPFYGEFLEGCDTCVASKATLFAGVYQEVLRAENDIF